MKFQKNTLAAVILAALLAPTAVLAQDTTDSADTTDVSESFTGGDFTGDWKDNDMGLVADGFIAVAEDFAARDAALASLADQIEATDRNLTHAVFTRVSKAVYNADKKKIEDTVNPLVEGVNRLAEETLKVKDKANSTAQKVDDLEFTVNGAVEAVKAKVDQAQYDEDKKLIGGAFKEVKDAILTIQNDMDNVDGWLSVLDEDKADKAEVDEKIGALEVHTTANRAKLAELSNDKVDNSVFEETVLKIQDDMDNVDGWLSVLSEDKVDKVDYEADKKKIEDTVNPLVEGVNRLAEETLKVKDKANSTAQKVDDLEFTVNGAVEAVKTKAEKADVEALMGDVEESFEKIGELSAKNRELDAKKVNKAEYDADKKKIEDTVNPLVEGVNRLAEETLKVKDKANSTAQKVDDLEFTVNGAVEAVKTKADKAELEAKADKTALEAKADKTALEAKADKTALEAKADKTALALKANIADVYSKTQADEKFVTQAQNIAVTQTVARNSQRIANLEGSVASLNTRVNAVEQKLKRGLATQAALSGLFQPYNVGKVNVTAAVGGYQSKSAVAVGMGYRVNEKFAAKAGVAVGFGNSSSASYHVGVNYEF